MKASIDHINNEDDSENTMLHRASELGIVYIIKVKNFVPNIGYSWFFVAQLIVTFICQTVHVLVLAIILYEMDLLNVAIHTMSYFPFDNKQLIRAGAHCDTRNGKGELAIHVAASNGHFK